MVSQAPSASALAAVAVVAVGIYLWYRRRADSATLSPPLLKRNLDSSSSGGSRSVAGSSNNVEAVLSRRVSATPGLAKPVEGFLVAATAAPAGFGGLIPEDAHADGPASTDSEDDDVAQDKTSWSIARRGPNAEVKEVRDSSFRRRSADKVERASGLKAKSSSLASHLVTPAMHNRSVVDYHKAQGTPLIGSRTIAGLGLAGKSPGQALRIPPRAGEEPEGLKGWAGRGDGKDTTSSSFKRRTSKDRSRTGASRALDGLSSIAGTPHGK